MTTVLIIQSVLWTEVKIKKTNFALCIKIKSFKDLSATPFHFSLEDKKSLYFR